MTAALVILAAADLGYSIAQSAGDEDVSSADLYSPLIKIATFVSILASCFCLL